MRRFRFVGDPSDYRIEGFDPPFKVGEVYEGSLKDPQCISSVQEYADSLNDEDWQEVFETELKTLHKETDLGYFAGLAMQGILANSSDIIVNLKDSDKSYFAVLMAKELIKQLNEETK